MAINAAAQDHIPNRAMISSNIEKRYVTAGTFTSFATIHRKIPMANGKIRERFSDVFDISCFSFVNYNLL